MVGLRSVLWFGMLSAPVWAQIGSPQCNVSAVPPLVHAEGLAERLGDIILSCTGQAGRVVQGNLTVNLNTTVTNRLTSGKLDAALTVDTGSGRTLLAQPELLTPGQVVYAGISFPIGPSGATELRITNLRADATQSGAAFQNIQATLAFNPPSLLGLVNNRVVVGVPTRGLLASSQLGVIASQIGSPLPETINFRNLIERGTRFASTRITEGYPGAFEPKGGTSDTGTRVLVRFTGYPTDARVFAPNVIIGSNGRTPTAAGDFGGRISGGEYQVGSLALVRLNFTDPNGIGGFAGPVSVGQVFDDVGEVPMSNGSGYVVYEVVDANPSSIESAQIPIFIGLPRTVEARTLTTSRDVFLAPVSTSNQASPSQPIPRFAATNAPSDCTTQTDCDQFQPKLAAYPQPTDFTARSGASFQLLYIPFDNVGGGVMAWTARVEYKTGSDWIRIFPTSGLQGGTVRLDVLPIGLAPGKYEATFIIDAGPAGIARYPVTLTVLQPLPPSPTIASVGSAATFTGPIVAGGLATIKGTNFNGANLSVTFDNKPARILFSNAEQINVQVPSDLTGKTTQLVVTGNGQASTAKTVPLEAVAPGIFPGAVVNQDNRVNTPETPVTAGTYISIYATGLLPAQGNPFIEVKFGDTYWSNLQYAGPAPGIPGVQQINFLVPIGTPTSSVDMAICSSIGDVQRACSPTVRVHVRAAQ